MSIVDELDLDDTDGPAKDVDGVPYCRKHHCRMHRGSSGKKGNPTRYYRCPVSGCEETAQSIKTHNQNIVPESPMECPRCVVDGKPVTCERDPRSSSQQAVVLTCPRCNWKSSPFVVPHLAALHGTVRKRPIIEDIGLR